MNPLQFHSNRVPFRKIVPSLSSAVAGYVTQEGKKENKKKESDQLKPSRTGEHNSR